MVESEEQNGGKEGVRPWLTPEGRRAARQREGRTHVNLSEGVREDLRVACEDAGLGISQTIRALVGGWLQADAPPQYTLLAGGRRIEVNLYTGVAVEKE